MSNDRIGNFMLNRRRLLTLTAAGISVTAIGSLGARSARAAELVRWVSPRGTIEVLDDYPYWVGKKFGYFGDIETTLEPGPSDATATVKLVDQNQADVGYPSPGVFSLALAQGIPLVSVFHMGGSDVFDFAFRKGEAPQDLKALEGKTIVLSAHEMSLVEMLCERIVLIHKGQAVLNGPLAEINRETVPRLNLAWTLDLDVTNNLSTPLAVDGVIYVASGYSIVHAVDAKTGQFLRR